MAKLELGSKRTCTSCGAKFYDLQKMPVECPKCETTFIPDILLPSKDTTPVETKPVEEKVEKAKAEESADIEVISLDEVEEEAGDDDDEIAAIADVDLGNDDDSDSDTSDDDDTFLETDSEDDSDVSGLIGGVAADDDET